MECQVYDRDSDEYEYPKNCLDVKAYELAPPTRAAFGQVALPSPLVGMGI
jgi:hypothetical protein